MTTVTQTLERTRLSCSRPDIEKKNREREREREVGDRIISRSTGIQRRSFKERRTDRLMKRISQKFLRPNTAIYSLFVGSLVDRNLSFQEQSSIIVLHWRDRSWSTAWEQSKRKMKKIGRRALPVRIWQPSIFHLSRHGSPAGMRRPRIK